MTKPDPFRYFKTSREIIRLAVMQYMRFLLSLRNVEDLLRERRIDVSHETMRYRWNRFRCLHFIDWKVRASLGSKWRVTGEAKHAAMHKRHFLVI